MATNRMANFRRMVERFAQEPPLLSTQEKIEVMNSSLLFSRSVEGLQVQLNNRFDWVYRTLQNIKRRLPN